MDGVSLNRAIDKNQANSFSWFVLTTVRKEDYNFKEAVKTKHVSERRERALQKELEKKIGLQLT